MSFQNTHYLFAMILAIVCFVVLNIMINRSYLKWIKTYWNYEQTKRNKISQFFYYLGISLILFSLLDLRGPEEKVKAAIPDQKTIIILDSSASMLAEDIKPNRFSKAIQVARHFVKNAPGHQIAIVLFSDVQKRLMPFTDDIDLIDSRLAALDKTNAVSGGSNISQAIKEAVGYFQTENSNDVPMGNILVFTDAEESEGGDNLTLGDNINLAVVGIGTAKGANIPLRWDDGTFRGFKTSKGDNVTTKLDENYIKKLGKNVKNYHYWIANSYSLPTLEIKDFFKASIKKNNNQGDISIRPVLSHLLLIPGILFFCLSVIIGRFKTFHTSLAILILFSCFSIEKSFAQESDEGNSEGNSEEKKEKEIPEAIKKQLPSFKDGKLDSKHILKIAEDFLRNNDPERASLIYGEYAQDSKGDEVQFNAITSLLAEGKQDEAIVKALDFFKESTNEDLKNKMRSNLLLAGDPNNSSKSKDKNKDKNKDKKDDQKKDQEKDQKEDQKEDKNKDKQDNSKDQKNDPKKDQSDDKKDSKDQDKGKSDKDQKPKDKDAKKDPKDKDKTSKDPKDLNKPEDQTPQTLEEKEKQIEQKRKMVKTPAMIKQILNDDRELQKTLMDTSTNEKGKNRDKRDW